MRFLRQSIAALAATALFCAPLSACASDMPGPTILAPPSEAPSPGAAVSTSSAEPVPEPGPVSAPVLPVEAKEQTAAGAMAFVRHYFAVVDYAYATGDTAPLAAVSDPACRPCAGVKDMIDTTVLAGGSWETEATTVTEVSVPEGEPMGAVNVLLTYSSETAHELSPSGDEVRSFPALIEQGEHLVIVPDGSSWLMFDYGDVI
jgi:hypothetical protein